MVAPEPSEDSRQKLLLSVHHQFAENHRSREDLFVKLLPLLGAVVGGYAYVYHGYHDQVEVFSLITVAAELLLFFAALVVCILSHNFRRDQWLNARIRNELDVIGEDNIYPKSYDPSLGMGSRRAFSWMPDFYGLFYVMLLTFQVLLFASFVYRSDITLIKSYAELSFPVTLAVIISVIAVSGSIYGSIHHFYRLLVHFDLIEFTSAFRFLVLGLWFRRSELEKQTGTRQEVRTRYWSLFRRSADLSSCMKQLINKLESKSTLQEVVLYHVVRAHSILRAITAACSAGNASEAIVLLRSLLVLVINIRWMLREDAESRTERFADFEVVRKRLTADILVEYGRIPDEAKESYNGFLRTEVDAVRGKYGLQGDEDLQSWSGISIVEMARQVDLVALYYLIFGYVADIDYTSPNMAGHYLDRDENGQARVMWSNSDDKIEQVMFSAMDFFVQTVQILLNVNELSSARFTRLAQKHLEQYERYAMAAQKAAFE